MKAYSEIVDWTDVQDLVKPLNTALYEILNELPNKPKIIKAHYPFGMKILDGDHFIIPEGASLAAKSKKDFPYGLVLEKNLEMFLDHPGALIPGTVYTPGTWFPMHYELGPAENINVRPQTMRACTSGLRNISIMPLYADSDNFKVFCDEFDIRPGLNPQNPQHHHEMIHSTIQQAGSSWHSSILLFNHEWRDKLENDKSWAKLKIYILEQSIRRNAVSRNMFFLDYVIADFMKNYRVKLKPFSIETIKTIFRVAFNDVPGLRPAVDDSGFPRGLFTDLFATHYAPTTTPVMIESCVYDPRENDYPVYHSMFTTQTNVHDPKTFRPMVFLAEVSNFLNNLYESFETHPFTQSTVYAQLSKIMTHHCYSVLGDDKAILNSGKLVEHDARFKKVFEDYESVTHYGFCNRSIFTKALVSIKLDMP